MSNEWDDLDFGVLEGIVARADDKVRARGRAIKRGEILSCTRSGSRLRARVRGSDVAPYRVDLDVSSGDSACTCPYQWGEVCKHTVAVARLAIDDPGSFEPSDLKQRVNIDLSRLSEDDAIALLDELRERFPKVVREFVAVQARDFEYGDPDEEDTW